MFRGRRGLLELLALVSLAALAPGCERGCLWSALTHAGAGSDPTSPGAAYFGMGQVDCPDGLARCTGGVVQTSQAATRPSPCHGNPETCACPWIVAERCPHETGCVADGLEVPLAAHAAVAQLCAPSPSGAGDPVFARPASIPASLTLAETSACEGEAFACVGSHVVACQPPRVVGTCARACAPDGTAELAVGGPVADHLSDAHALAILCAR